MTDMSLLPKWMIHFQYWIRYMIEASCSLFMVKPKFLRFSICWSIVKGICCFLTFSPMKSPYKQKNDSTWSASLRGVSSSVAYNIWHLKEHVKCFLYICKYLIFACTLYGFAEIHQKTWWFNELLKMKK